MNNFAKTDILTENQKHLFVAGLEKGLDLRKDEDGKTIWNCYHNYEFVHARRALDQIGMSVEQIDEVLEFCKKNGGYCDCEIMLNVICGDEQ
jgi:alanine racemase